jgi:hypothetical protein
VRATLGNLERNFQHNPERVGEVCCVQAALISRTLSEFIVGLAYSYSYPGRCPGLEFANAFGVHAFSTVDWPRMLIPLKGRPKFR